MDNEHLACSLQHGGILPLQTCSTCTAHASSSDLITCQAGSNVGATIAAARHVDYSPLSVSASSPDSSSSAMMSAPPSSSPLMCTTVYHHEGTVDVLFAGPQDHDM